jgi:hypothetical protein
MQVMVTSTVDFHMLTDEDKAIFAEASKAAWKGDTAIELPDTYKHFKRLQIFDRVTSKSIRAAAQQRAGRAAASPAICANVVLSTELMAMAGDGSIVAGEPAWRREMIVGGESFSAEEVHEDARPLRAVLLDTVGTSRLHKQLLGSSNQDSRKRAALRIEMLHAISEATGVAQMGVVAGTCTTDGISVEIIAGQPVYRPSQLHLALPTGYEGWYASDVAHGSPLIVDPNQQNAICQAARSQRKMLSKRQLASAVKELIPRSFRTSPQFDTRSLGLVAVEILIAPLDMTSVIQSAAWSKFQCQRVEDNEVCCSALSRH